MKPIEGISLDDVVRDVELAMLRDHQVNVASAVRGLYSELYRLEKEREQAEHLAAKSREKIAKALDKLAKIKANDWSVLELPKPGGDSPKAD